jgi:hypothetical protein
MEPMSTYSVVRGILKDLSLALYQTVCKDNVMESIFKKYCFHFFSYIDLHLDLSLNLKDNR